MHRSIVKLTIKVFSRQR